jgi:hypothetical protein
MLLHGSKSVVIMSVLQKAEDEDTQIVLPIVLYARKSS